MRTEMVERTLRPGHGEAQAFFRAGAVGGILGALVEGHADVCTERDLHIHGMFGREEVTAAVEVRAEAYAFVCHLAELCEAVDLKTAGVSEHGARPADEAMKAAHAANGFVTRPKIEMVS